MHLVTRTYPEGSTTTTRCATAEEAHQAAADMLRTEPQYPVKISVPVAPAEPPPSGYRVTREGPGAESKEYGVHQRRGTADKIAHNVSRAHPTALVVVEPIRCAS